MRLLCKKFILLLFPLVLIFAAMGLVACNGGGETHNVTVNSNLPLTAPQIELAENVISWTAVENAGKYEVYENNSRINVQTETSFTISQTAVGTYKYRIRALSADKNHSSSKLSNEVVYTVKGKIQLAAPQVSIDEAAKTVSWAAVEKADGYKVLENGEIVSSQTETSYTITHTETGKYKYTVIATSASEDYSESRSSNEVTYIISEQLATPHIELDEATKTISWTAVEHANTYFIYEDGYVIEASWDSTSYVIEQTIVGEHTYCITALGDDSSVYKMSEKSNTVTYVIEPTVLATPDGLKEERDLQGHVTLVWNEVEDAGGYVIYENNRKIEKRWTDSAYPITHVEADTYEYKVQAIPARDDKQYLESGISEPIEITIEDNRTQLSEPKNFRIETREFYYKDSQGNIIPGTVPVSYECLVWDEVANAENYLVYESGKRVYSTTETYIEIGKQFSEPRKYKFQVKAVAHGTLYKSSELSEVFDDFKIDVENIKYTVRLNVDAASRFSQSVQVGLFPQDNNGLPAQTVPIGGTTRNLTTTEPAEIEYNNAISYVAKIINLPAGYYATEVRLSAMNPEGTIYVYNSTSDVFSVSNSNSVNIKIANEPQSKLFIPNEAGQYTISTTETKEMTIGVGASARTAIDTGNGLTMFTFSADANEAVLISVNSPEIGAYRFTIERGAKTPSLKIGTERGDNANVISGDMQSVEYSLNLSTDTEYIFNFSPMYLGPDRFATVTINPDTVNEEVYEFDGGYEYEKHIFIKAGQNIKIRVDIIGTTTDETMSNVYFSVFPLTED